MTEQGTALDTGEWREDGTGKEMVDGTPTTCDAAFNRGYDKGYCAGMSAGAPPVRMPRWDQDSTVLRFGWLPGRCGEQNAELGKLKEGVAQALMLAASSMKDGHPTPEAAIAEVARFLTEASA
jgi:hypothetical protein